MGNDMAYGLRMRVSALRNGLRLALVGPQIMAFVPAMALAAFWIGGEVPLILTALGVPVLYALLARPGAEPVRPTTPADTLDQAATAALAASAGTDRSQALFLLEPGKAQDLVARLGPRGTGEVARAMETALRDVLREGDRVLRQGAGLRYAVLPASPRRMDLEGAIQIASRLQTAVEEPVALDQTTLYLDCAVGLCLSGHAPKPGPAAWIAAAEAALQEALSAGTSAIRAFSPAMPPAAVAPDELADAAETALAQGQIVAWFQPQISTDTGQISGMESLARWAHPSQGVIPPDRFLPALAARGRIERLGEVMLYQALTALGAWDKAGLDIPRVSVNLAPEDLRNPKLCDKIAWELDRFAIAPARRA